MFPESLSQRVAEKECCDQAEEALEVEELEKEVGDDEYAVMSDVLFNTK